MVRVLRAIGDPVAVAVASAGMGVEALLAEVRQAVTVGILRGVDDAVGVAIAGIRFGDARPSLEAVA